MRRPVRRWRRRASTVTRKIDIVAPVIDAWLAGDRRLKASVIHERLTGAQAPDDWDDEGRVLLDHGVAKVYSLPMTLSYSRDPFCCLGTSQDLGTFFDCHRRGVAHFGGVPGAVVYDRTKTVVRRHVAPREAVPLHPEAAAFAEHYGFVIDVLAAYRPTGKGRSSGRSPSCDHVLIGREFGSVAEDGPLPV